MAVGKLTVELILDTLVNECPYIYRSIATIAYIPSKFSSTFLNCKALRRENKLIKDLELLRMCKWNTYFQEFPFAISEWKKQDNLLRVPVYSGNFSSGRTKMACSIYVPNGISENLM